MLIDKSFDTSTVREYDYGAMQKHWVKALNRYRNALE